MHRQKEGTISSPFAEVTLAKTIIVAVVAFVRAQQCAAYSEQLDHHSL